MAIIAIMKANCRDIKRKTSDKKKTHTQPVLLPFTQPHHIQFQCESIFCPSVFLFNILHQHVQYLCLYRTYIEQSQSSSSFDDLFAVFFSSSTLSLTHAFRSFLFDPVYFCFYIYRSFSLSIRFLSVCRTLFFLLCVRAGNGYHQKLFIESMHISITKKKIFFCVCVWVSLSNLNGLLNGLVTISYPSVKIHKLFNSCIRICLHSNLFIGLFFFFCYKCKMCGLTIEQ